MNKTTTALTQDQYKEIISTMKQGFTGMRPNPRVATALILEANLGLRISDILRLRPSDIIRDGERYRLDIVEQKTGKKRTFTVPLPIYQYIQIYCLENNIRKNDRIFPISTRTVQSILRMTCTHIYGDDKGSKISTHSFRKFFASQIYVNNDYDIVLVQHLLQHSSPAITQRYIGIEPKKVESAILGHMQLL